jgi:hypothetical protein
MRHAIKLVGEWRYSPTILELGTRWKRVVGEIVERMGPTSEAGGGIC